MGMSIYAAPAKINLSLRVLSKRPDGYHEVDLLMARLNLADELEFSPADAAELVCDDASLPVDESNLVMRAVREFEKAYGRPVRRRISLRKRIPHGAGLGGGSSDAATTLLALNEILGTGYDLSELSAMAAAIGSDVPFFLNPVPSRCTGRGEIVAPDEALANWRSPIVVLKPIFGVSTPDAYKRLHDARRVRGLPYGVQKVSGISLVNDLERPVFAKYPFVGLLKSWLLCQPGVRAAMMSGSGSALFALTDTSEQARLIAERAREDYDPTLFTWHGTVNPEPGEEAEEAVDGSREGVTTVANDAPTADDNTDASVTFAEPEVLILRSEAADGARSDAEDAAMSSAAAETPEALDAEAPASPAAKVSRSPMSRAAAPDAASKQEDAPAEKAPAAPRKRGRKPEYIRRALAEVEELREQLRSRQREVDEHLKLLQEAGIDPNVPRRGRRPALLQVYLGLYQQVREAEAQLSEALERIEQMERERS